MITEEVANDFAKAFHAYNGYPVSIIKIDNDKIDFYSVIGGFQTLDRDTLESVTSLLWLLHRDRVIRSARTDHYKFQLEKMLHQLVTVDISKIV